MQPFSLPVLLAIALGAEAPADPFPAPAFRVATLFTAQEMRAELRDASRRARAVEWCRRHGVEHALVESFRDGYEAEEATLAAVRDEFRAAGLLVSGCVTPTGLGKRSTGWKVVSCYTAPETRAQLRGIFERAAKLFERIMIDDFLFTDCQCGDCKKAKGDASWSEYRIRLMREVSEKDILGPARAARPDVRIILKYPQWYDDFHNRGYDVTGQTALYPAIWVGTETRDPENASWGRKAQYEAYFIMRWLGAIGGEKTGGGWFDPYGTSPATYVEQARQTVLGGAREMLLFCHASLVEPQNARCADALVPELPALRELAARIRGKLPIGVAAAKPPNSQPAPGEDYFFDFAGMLGIPLVPCAEIPAAARAALITSHAARDPATLAWLRASPRRPVVLTAAAEKALPEDGLAPRSRPVGRLAWSNDPREVMDIPREALDKLRNDLLEPFGVRLSAPGRVALYLFAPAGSDGGYAAIENFRDASVEVALSGLVEAAGEGAGRIVLPPDSAGEKARLGPEGRLVLPARGLVGFPVARSP
ncbi:MAG: hypothetical protein ACUVYA_16395 [Planctomycetota bacterium]